MPTLAEALAAKIAKDSLTNTAAAEAIGISLPSLRGTLYGRTFPNARTLDRFSRFLGVSEDDVKALIAAGRSSGKPAKGGRKKAAKAAPAAAAAEVVKGKAGRRKKTSSLSEAVAELEAAAAGAQALIADDLALAVHSLNAKQRKVIASVLAGL